MPRSVNHREVVEKMKMLFYFWQSNDWLYEQVFYLSNDNK